MTPDSGTAFAEARIGWLRQEDRTRAAGFRPLPLPACEEVVLVLR